MIASPNIRAKGETSTAKDMVAAPFAVCMIMSMHKRSQGSFFARIVSDAGQINRTINVEIGPQPKLRGRVNRCRHCHYRIVHYVQLNC